MTDKLTSLKAMAAAPDVAVKKTDLWKIDPMLIEEEPGFNLRDYNAPDVQAQIEAFADAYTNGRYVPPLIVRVTDDGTIFVVDGHTRRRGARLAIERGTELPFVEATAFRGSDTERVEVMLRAAEGLPLKPLEIALGYLRLERKGYDNKAISAAVNRTTARVEQLLLLAKANADVHELVRSGSVSADVAIDAVRAHGEGAGAFLQRHVRPGEKVTRKDVRGTPIPPAIATHVTGAFGEMFGRRSRVLEGLARWEKDGMKKGAKIEVDAASLNALKEAHEQLVAINERRAKRGAEKDAKARQRDIDDDD